MVTVSPPRNTSSPVITVVVKRPRYIRKSRKESWTLKFIVACRGLPAIKLRFAGQFTAGPKNIFAGSSILSVFLTSHS